MAFHGARDAEQVRGRLVAMVDASCAVNVDAGNCAPVVLHSANNTSQHRQIYAVTVNVAVLLFSRVCR